ncbi:EAL domain-containing response regulator [Pseudomonas sp. TH34]|uniref:EAL domain-containing response regulator n=1 Tax=Pseudomonas sp. TH34 TaxID=2796399 RepID=UPI001913BFDC|nr:EAL domain-containing response regulator [Pseudomonas sp. TH34]MBK5408900.1 EAL domain-containing response regulator [Pseudomonas sp. TH34]
MRHLNYLVLEAQPFHRRNTVGSLQQVVTGQVHQAASGEEALELLHCCGGVDIAICNLHTTGTAGLTFLRTVGEARLVRAVLLCGPLEASLRKATVAMIRSLGMYFLGGQEAMPDIAQMQVLVDELRAVPESPAPQLPAEQPSLAEILLGFNDDQFVPYYQPKMTLHSGEQQGAEVLARWNHPQLGVLAPGYFLPAIEEHHLMDKLFVRMLEKGLALQQALSGDMPEPELAFNVQAAQLASKTFAEQVETTLRQYQVSANKLMFEITETDLVGSTANHLENLIHLRLMGCGLAMDDFGTGYSSLKRLLDFPFSQLKLDGSFVRDLESRPGSRAVIEGAVRLAESLAISLVVEGVETAEQQKQLIKLGCSVGQGFGLARPMSGEHFLQYCLEASHTEENLLISAG